MKKKLIKELLTGLEKQRREQLKKDFSRLTIDMLRGQGIGEWTLKRRPRNIG